MNEEEVDARVVKALGHPTRVRILNVLRTRELASPVELSNELGIALGTVGYHVRRLESLGFLELAKRTQRRGAVEHHYRAREVLDGHGAVDGGAPRASRDGRGAEATAVATAARAALASGGFDAVAARADRRVVLLDAVAQQELERLLPRWTAAIERIARSSAARLADGSDEAAAHRCVSAVMCFAAPSGVGESD